MATSEGSVALPAERRDSHHNRSDRDRCLDWAPQQSRLVDQRVLFQAAGAVRTSRRVALLVLTVALRPTAGVASALLGRSADRTFLAAQGTTQLIVSVLLPLVGILLAAELRRSGETRTLPACLAAGAIAVRVAVAGLLVAVVATSAAAGRTPGRWHGAASLAAGGLVVQVVCVLCGVALAPNL